MNVPDFCTLPQNKQSVLMLLYWEHTGRTFEEIKREEDPGVLYLLIKDLLALNNDGKKTLEFLREHPLINDIYVDVFQRVLANNPEVKKKAMDIIGEGFPEIKKELNKQGYVSIEMFANAVSIPEHEIRDMVEEQTLNAAPMGEA